MRARRAEQAGLDGNDVWDRHFATDPPPAARRLKPPTRHRTPRGCAALLPLPHGVSAASKPRGSDRCRTARLRMGERELPVHRGEFARRTGEAQRQRFVVVDAGGHELGQAGGDELTLRDAAGERAAGAGDHRQPRPQRVAGRRVRVVRQRVEEQVGQAVPREMCQLRTRGAKATATPRRAGLRFARRLRDAAALSSSSHNALPGTASSSRIHDPNVAGPIFWLLLKQQKTKPASGRPASARVGAAAGIARVVSMTQ